MCSGAGWGVIVFLHLLEEGKPVKIISLSITSIKRPYDVYEFADGFLKLCVWGSRRSEGHFGEWGSLSLERRPSFIAPLLPIPNPWHSYLFNAFALSSTVLLFPALALG